jgi:hypothetical protein
MALAPQAVSAEDAVKAAAPTQTAPAVVAKPVGRAVVLASVTPPWRVGRHKSSFTRIQKYIVRLRCAHIGCPGVHTLGVAY